MTDVEKTPLVIPFVHTGMQDVMPIGSKFPSVDKKVGISSYILLLPCLAFPYMPLLSGLVSQFRECHNGIVLRIPVSCLFLCQVTEHFH